MTTRILALDPGTTHTGYALLGPTTCQPLNIGKAPNHQILTLLHNQLVGDRPHFQPRITRLAIEMVASYGMPVGRDVFETCVWIGRYAQLADTFTPTLPVDLVYRRDVKLHHCHSSKAKDSNVTQALVDRFAAGQPNRGKGTKAAPGWFYGFAGDMWQAYALGVYIADTAPLLPDDAAEPAAQEVLL